jgi:bacteriocin-like protein
MQGAPTMSTDKIDPNKKSTEVPPKDSKTELTEEELKHVSGGATVQLTDVQVTQVPLSGHGGDK